MAARRLHGNWFDVTVFFDVIDWQQPWLVPLHTVAVSIMSRRESWRHALNDAAGAAGIRNHRGHPIQFVPQSDLPVGVAYEAFISATGCVPTRDNLHDFFNALVWLTFPNIKIQLNTLQAAEIERVAAQQVQAPSQQRGKLRDAATIFDENAALLVTRNTTLTDALRAHQWSEVFVVRRAEFESDCETWLFGHALMEKLVAPYKAITAHVRVVVVDNAFFLLEQEDKCRWLDLAVTRQIADGIVTADFTPLPVLGVPGWWCGQDSVFYADMAVFRPAHVAKA